jgi:hypothetical protein
MRRREHFGVARRRRTAYVEVDLESDVERWVGEVDPCWRAAAASAAACSRGVGGPAGTPTTRPTARPPPRPITSTQHWPSPQPDNANGGICTECGMGRVAADDVPKLLDLHREILTATTGAR